jgi:hypothetical protein
MAENYQAERLKILEMIDAGDISPKDGLQLLEALGGVSPGMHQEDMGALRESSVPDALASLGFNEEVNEAVASEDETMHTVVLNNKPELSPDLDADSWRGWWKYVFWTGVGFMAVGVMLLLMTFQLAAALFWYFVAGIPLFFGFFIMALGLFSRSSRWIHIRIRQQPGEYPSKIALSFPLPIRPMAWFIRVFGRWIPHLNNTGLDELILALGDSASPENPLYFQVQDDEDGDQVEVYIG